MMKLKPLRWWIGALIIIIAEAMTQKLEFVHIPKNAGTTIEFAGAKAGINWGACHYIRWCGIEPDRNHTGGSVWHQAPTDLDEDTEHFAIVRNPYDRIISAYYYCYRNKNSTNINSRTQLNKFVLNELDLHWTHRKPQSEYIYDSDGKKLVQHILYFETLSKDGEFEKLMHEFDLNVTLPEEKRNNRASGTKLGVSHLGKHAIHYINEKFQDDFEHFGYEKIE